VRCPQCKDEAEKYVQTCYWCRKRFSDAEGIIVDPEDARDELEMMFGRRPKTDEEKTEYTKQRKKSLKQHGVVTTKGGGVARDDWEAFKAKNFPKKQVP